MQKVITHRSRRKHPPCLKGPPKLRWGTGRERDRAWGIFSIEVLWWSSLGSQAKVGQSKPKQKGLGKQHRGLIKEAPKEKALRGRGSLFTRTVGEVRTRIDICLLTLPGLLSGAWACTRDYCQFKVTAGCLTTQNRCQGSNTIEQVS